MYVAEPSPLLASLFSALGADALGHVVYRLYLKSVRVGYGGNGGIFKTECAVTYFAMEMNVAVIINLTMSMA